MPEPRRFTAHPDFGPTWTVYDGYERMEGETYANAEMAQARANYLSIRVIEPQGKSARR